MPADYTHYLFANKYVKSDNQKLTNLASQGPDYFFYYGYKFAYRPAMIKVKKFGSMLHHQDPAKIFNFCLDYALKQNESCQKILIDYLRGFVAHYVLDSIVHPYVFYRTGFDENGNLKGKYHHYHSLFETNLDVVLATYYKVKLNPDIVFDYQIMELKVVSLMYKNMAKSVFDIDYIKDNTFTLAVKDMKFIEKLLYSKTGKKKKVFDFLFKNTYPSDMSHPLVVKDEELIDYLNLKHNLWLDPVSKEEHYESVLDLFTLANKKMQEFELIINKALSGQDYEKEVEKFTSLKDFHGAVANKKKKYFKNAWDK